MDYENILPQYLNLDHNLLYDILIIGGGPAGLNAALYGKRKGLEVGIISCFVGGQLQATNEIDNYLGLPNIDGPKLASAFIQHINNLKIPVAMPITVKEITKNNKDFFILCDNNLTYKSKTIIFATGGLPRKLDVPGESEFTGRGVTYCTTCDAPFYRGKDVIVTGGGNSAAEAVLDLVPWVKSISVIIRTNWRADQVIVDKIKQLNNVTAHFNSQVVSINGNQKVESITILNTDTNKLLTMPTDGVFVEIGIIPNNALVKNLVALNKYGEVIVNENQETSLPGFFAAGDITNQGHKQIIVAASQGAIAALEANNYISKDY